MAGMTGYGDSIKSKVESALAEVISDVRDAVVKEAVAAFETRVKAAVANTTLALADFYSVETMGNQFIIHVKFDKDKS